MPTIENSDLRIVLDPLPSLGRLASEQRSHFAAVTISCDVFLEEDVCSDERLHLAADLIAVDGDEEFMISPIHWATTTATGAAALSRVYLIPALTPAGRLRIERTSYVAHNLLDEDPPYPLHTPSGFVKRSEADELGAAFKLTRHRRNGPQTGEVVATATGVASLDFMQGTDSSNETHRSSTS